MKISIEVKNNKVVVKSEEKQSVTVFRGINDADKQVLYALCDHLGYDPDTLLCFDD